MGEVRPGDRARVGHRVDPGRLHVERRSPLDDGTALRTSIVLVHGVLDSGRSFGRVTHVLDPRRAVVAYDRRGYQRSRAAPSAAHGALAGHVEDLLALVGGEKDATGHAPIVVGHSYGAIVALAAAAERPGAFAAILAYEPPLTWHAWWPTDGGDALSPAVSGSGRAPARARSPVPGPGESPAAFAERFTRAVIGDRRFERLAPATRVGLAGDGPAAVAELDELRVAPPFEPSAITVPVIVAHGAQTSDRHARGAGWLTGVLPDAELVVLDGAAHGAHISHPRELADLAEMLARQVERGDPDLAADG